MSDKLTSGQWFTLATKDQHDRVKKYGRTDPPSGWSMARVQKGTWEGPGRYMLLTYQQSCPRGCCMDDVCELIPAADVARLVREEIRELAAVLKQAKGDTT